MSAKQPIVQSDEIVHHEFLFGGLAYSVSVFTLFPFYKTIFFQQLDGISWTQALCRLRTEGFGMVYRGVLPPLLQRCSSGAVMFGVQSLTERTLNSYPFSRNLNCGLTKGVSAVCAGFCEAPLMPFERVQTLLQNRNSFPSYRNTFHTLTSLAVDHGLRELYRGLTPILLRNSSANVLYFCGHKWLNDIRLHRVNESALDRSLWNFVLGGLLGGTIGFITFPLNVIKTRMQSSVGGEFETLRAAFLSLVYHQNGRRDIGRLFRGGPANFMRSILSWGIITMTYHFLLESYSGIKL